MSPERSGTTGNGLSLPAEVDATIDEGGRPLRRSNRNPIDGAIGHVGFSGSSANFVAHQSRRRKLEPLGGTSLRNEGRAGENAG